MEYVRNNTLYVAKLGKLKVDTRKYGDDIITVDTGCNRYAIVRYKDYQINAKKCYDVFTEKEYYIFDASTYNDLKYFHDGYAVASLIPIEDYLKNLSFESSMLELKRIYNRLNNIEESEYYPSDAFLYLIYKDFSELDNYSLSEEEKSEVIYKLLSLAKTYTEDMNSSILKDQNGLESTFDTRRKYVMKLSEIESVIQKHGLIFNKQLEDDYIELKRRMRGK